MGLFKRVGDIISANLNELIDSVEDPEKMLNQAVREMETAIARAMDSAAKVIANERLVERQLAEHHRQIELWQQRAEQSVRDDEDAARRALARRSEHEKIAAALDDQLQAARSTSAKLRRQIEAMRVRLVEARRKLVTLLARKQAADARRKLVSDVGGLTREDVAFSRFDRLCERVEQAEAEAEALVELSGDWTAEDETEPEIELELAKLKAAAS